jgi:hypothetical protein
MSWNKFRDSFSTSVGKKLAQHRKPVFYVFIAKLDLFKNRQPGTSRNRLCQKWSNDFTQVK